MNNYYKQMARHLLYTDWSLRHLMYTDIRTLNKTMLDNTMLANMLVLGYFMDQVWGASSRSGEVVRSNKGWVKYYHYITLKSYPAINGASRNMLQFCKWRHDPLRSLLSSGNTYIYRIAFILPAAVCMAAFW